MRRRHRRTATLVRAILTCWAAPAVADPCTAPLPPQSGSPIVGEVRYVGDGDSLCVGRTSDPETWVAVRLADFDAPELHSPTGPAAKAALSRIALGRSATCVTVRGRSGRVVVFDRIIARCLVGGTSIGRLMREAGIREGGR